MMKASEILDAAMRCRPLTGNVNAFAREIERMVRAEIVDDMMRICGTQREIERLRALRDGPWPPNAD